MTAVYAVTVTLSMRFTLLELPDSGQLHTRNLLCVKGMS